MIKINENNFQTKKEAKEYLKKRFFDLNKEVLRSVKKVNKYQSLKIITEFEIGYYAKSI